MTEILNLEVAVHVGRAHLGGPPLLQFLVPAAALGAQVAEVVAIRGDLIVVVRPAQVVTEDQAAFAAEQLAEHAGAIAKLRGMLTPHGARQ